MLAPVFLWGALAADGRWTARLALAFVLVHLCLYGGATAFNSVYDRDQGPVGGLRAPPPVPAGLLPVSLVLQAAGALAAVGVSRSFALVYLAMAALGCAYSHPRVRFKARPWASLLVVSLGQGVLGFLLGYFAAGGTPRSALSARAFEAALVAAAFTTALYPLTQIYQVDEDRRRGDHTFAVVYGARGCFRFAIAGVLVAGAALADYLNRHFAGTEAAAAGLGAGAVAAYLAAWARRYQPGDLEGNYTRVMRLGYGTALALGGVILWHLGRER
jgi:1,4-dihydroxy-2-naphthoate octaprenyltransferase